MAISKVSKTLLIYGPFEPKRGISESGKTKGKKNELAHLYSKIVLKTVLSYICDIISLHDQCYLFQSVQWAQLFFLFHVHPLQHHWGLHVVAG